MEPTTPTPQPRLKKVLCIEDEHFISELYTRALTRAGYEVDVQLDGQKGLAAAQTDVYDIILLDLMVPSITGIEILRTLRDPRETPKMHARIIITTNLEQRDDVRADIEHQADGYLVKAEITPHQLVEFLGRLES
jgi:DNA-binding response OmpR family regulator